MIGLWKIIHRHDNMKTRVIAELFLFGIVAAYGCSSSPRPIPYLDNGQKWDRSIVVLGDWDGDLGTPYTYLHWAPVNAGFDEVGEVGSRDDHRYGRLYQWGAGSKEANVLAKMRYYNEPEPDFWYKGIRLESGYEGEKWNGDKGPCPQGWRLPTVQEFECLVMGRNGDSGWTTDGSYAGKKNYTGAEFFGLNDDLTSGKGVFFPAAGQIEAEYGSAFHVGESGGYWTSEAASIYAGPAGNYARAKSPALTVRPDKYDIVETRHSAGYSVRCVHDVE